MTHYTSLEHLRADKLRARQRLGKTAKRVRADLASSLMPQSNLLTGSSSRVLNIIGYSLAVYKTVRSMRVMYKFISKLL